MPTTTKNIYDAISDLIAATTTPTDIRQDATVRYAQKSSAQPWSRCAASDVDRRYMITMGPGGVARSYGNGSSHEASVTMTVTIGHVVGSDYAQSECRRVADATRLIEVITDRANYPDDVWIIRYTGDSLRDLDGVYTLTELRFDITYEESNS